MTLKEPDSFCNVMPLAIEVRNLQSIGGNISCIEIWQTRFLYCNGNRNSTTACPNVSNDRHLPTSNALLNHFKGHFNEQFCFRSRDQHSLVNAKIQAIKLFMPSEIGYWLMLLSTCDQGEILLFLL